MARTNKTEFDFDPNELNYLSGYVDGMSATVRSTAYIGSVLNYAHSKMTPELDAFIDMWAEASPESFHHVYEWPERFGDKSTIGNPMYRLWRHTIKGHGASKTASFEFKASIRPSPVNPILTTPGPGGRSVKEGVHIFYWKAMAMEYGLEITVAPKLAQYLAFVASAESGAKQTDARKTSGNIVFSKGPVSFTAGGGKTTGRFTNAFRFWWSQLAAEVFDRQVAPRLERDMVTDGVVGNYRSKSKTFSVTNNAGYSEGRAAAIRKLRKNERNYIAGAGQRFSRGGSDDDE